MDILGVLRGWQFFDHAGHLGGVIFAVYVNVQAKLIVSMTVIEHVAIHVEIF